MTFYHLCTKTWKTPSCRVGRIDHWMYVKDNTEALRTFNKCSSWKPSGPGWSLCS